MLITILILLSIYALIVTGLLFRARKQNQSSELDHDVALKKRQAMMADTIEQKADEAMNLHHSFHKFVPRQFIDHFAKSGEGSLELGRADEDRVAVLFCDIRGFTSLSEKMSPQELMHFLNSYFLRMNAPIHHNKGFIDKFIGDAIMALFDNPNGQDADKAADALNAAFEIQTALNLYNEHRAKSDYHAVKNGIGLHFGPVVLGTVGSDDRMDTTVIGDTVNIAQRLESLCTYFNVDIIASESTVLLAKECTDIEYRLLDNIHLRGKSVSIAVVEVLSHLPIDEKSLKLKAAEAINIGIEARTKGDVQGALKHFERHEGLFPNDLAISHHIRTCEMILKDPQWNGQVSV